MLNYLNCHDDREERCAGIEGKGFSLIHPVGSVKSFGFLAFISTKLTFQALLEAILAFLIAHRGKLGSNIWRQMCGMDTCAETAQSRLKLPPTGAAPEKVGVSIGIGMP